MTAFAIAAALATLPACGGPAPADAGAGPTARLEISTADGTLAFDVEIADTQAERERGLMWRTSLDEGAGMAFLFPEPTSTSFGMWNTEIPLSIAFWDTDGRIVRIFDMAPCREITCPTYRPEVPVVGAVEVARGALEGVRIGDVVRLLA